MSDIPRYSKAYLAGMVVQAAALALGVAALLIQLLRSNAELTFRYGGF